MSSFTHQDNRDYHHIYYLTKYEIFLLISQMVHVINFRNKSCLLISCKQPYSKINLWFLQIFSKQQILNTIYSVIPLAKFRAKPKLLDCFLTKLRAYLPPNLKHSLPIMNALCACLDGICLIVLNHLNTYLYLSSSPLNHSNLCHAVTPELCAHSTGSEYSR